MLASAIDTSVLVGYPAAEKYLGFDGHPSTIYLRAQNDRVNAVDNLLAATANPENPSEVNVSQPSDALVAQADAKSALNGLFLGLGAVALLVGAVGVANIMIISVLERRSEIGLRRALGATKGHIRTQFLSEAVLLGLLGGTVGVALGAAATAVYAHTKHWATVIPTEAWAGGIAASLIIGAARRAHPRPTRRTPLTHPSPVVRLAHYLCKHRDCNCRQRTPVPHVSIAAHEATVPLSRHHAPVGNASERRAPRGMHNADPWRCAQARFVRRCSRSWRGAESADISCRGRALSSPRVA